jgi:hypothetical protein
MTSTAPHTLSMLCANQIGVTQMAQTSIVTLRAAFTLYPRRIMLEDIQPPATLPRSEMM